ncbi:MAG: hypothetical protein DMH00_13425 [Acidobacteria bacterium]|nr:MAG: hypothetical protein DMH00_13425 [Acidobacteriota bacterium]
MATLSPAPRPGSPSPAISSGPRSALLADEPREFRDFVASVLKAAGFEVGVTDNGDEALLLAVSHRFDLILLNVYLRRMLGINVSERIKNNPALRDTPVILIGAPGGCPSDCTEPTISSPPASARTNCPKRSGAGVPGAPCRFK